MPYPVLSTAESGIPGAREATRMPCSPGAAFDTARPGGQTQSSEVIHVSPSLPVLNVFSSASSATTQLSQPSVESLELPANPAGGIFGQQKL